MTWRGVSRIVRGFLFDGSQTRKNVFYLAKMRIRGIDLRGASLESLGLSPERSVWYTDSGGPDLDVVLRSMAVSSTDSAFDFGCGKGGAMVTMSKYPFARVDGLDISPELVKVAQKNLARARVKNATVFCGDAAEFADLDAYTVVYMFNPFPEVVVRKVVDNLLSSWNRRPRRLAVVYKNPICHTLLMESGFQKTREFSHSNLPFHVYELPQRGAG